MILSEMNNVYVGSDEISSIYIGDTLVYNKGELTFRITRHPEDKSGSVGDTVYFEVRCTAAVSYQWQYSSAGRDTWGNSGMTGNKTNTLQVPVINSRNGQKYRCVCTDKDGNILTSNYATLTVV